LTKVCWLFRCSARR